MKTKIYNILSLLAFLLIVSCADDDNNDTFSFIPSREYNNEDICAFFDSELCDKEDANSFCWNGNIEVETCEIINSENEFHAFYTGGKDLPQIDFQNKTLFIGWKEIPHPVSGIEKVELKTKDNGYNLEVYTYMNPNDAYLNVPVRLYFWALFPKAAKASVNINVYIDNMLVKF